jgi:two-component SAPR family response regulator
MKLNRQIHSGRSGLQKEPDQLQTYKELIRIYKSTGDIRMARHYENLYKVGSTIYCMYIHGPQ